MEVYKAIEQIEIVKFHDGLLVMKRRKTHEKS